MNFNYEMYILMVLAVIVLTMLVWFTVNEDYLDIDVRMGTIIIYVLLLSLGVIIMRMNLVCGVLMI